MPRLARGWCWTVATNLRDETSVAPQDGHEGQIYGFLVPHPRLLCSAPFAYNYW